MVILVNLRSSQPFMTDLIVGEAVSPARLPVRECIGRARRDQGDRAARKNPDSHDVKSGIEGGTEPVGGGCVQK